MMYCPDGVGKSGVVNFLNGTQFDLNGFSDSINGLSVPLPSPTAAYEWCYHHRLEQ